MSSSVKHHDDRPNRHAERNFDGDVVENENTKVNVSQDDATVEVEYVARLTAIIGDEYKNKKKTFKLLKPAVVGHGKTYPSMIRDNFEMLGVKLFLYTEYKEKLLTTFRTIIAECAATRTNEQTNPRCERETVDASRTVHMDREEHSHPPAGPSCGETPVL